MSVESVKTKSFRDLLVWQKSMEVAEQTYDICRKLPKDETYGICSQMKRAAVSVPSNIAEGYKRNNLPEYVQFCGIASGSLAELETQALLVQTLFGINVQKLLEAIDHTQRMLTSLQKALNAKRATRNASAS